MKNTLETKDSIIYKGLPTKDGILEYLKNKNISNNLDYYQLITIYTVDEDSIVDEVHIIKRTDNKEFKAITLIESVDKKLPY